MPNQSQNIIIAQGVFQCVTCIMTMVLAFVKNMYVVGFTVLMFMVSLGLTIWMYMREEEDFDGTISGRDIHNE